LGQKKEKRDGNTEFTEGKTQKPQRIMEKADPSTARRLRSAGAPVGMTKFLDGVSRSCEKSKA
jgi:hypothetical protein